MNPEQHKPDEQRQSRPAVECTALWLYTTHIEGTDCLDDDVERRFDAAFIGVYPDQQAFVEMEITAYNWQQFLDHFTAKHNIPDGLLAWNYDRVYEYLLATDRTVIDFENSLYVYTKEQGGGQ